VTNVCHLILFIFCFLFQDLYHELHALDRFEQEYRSRLNRKGNTDRFEKGMAPMYNIVFHFRGQIVDAFCHLLCFHYLNKMALWTVPII
jgi:hypothetical protein